VITVFTPPKGFNWHWFQCDHCGELYIVILFNKDQDVSCPYCHEFSEQMYGGEVHFGLRVVK